GADPARAEGEPPRDRPVFFRDPDPATARAIEKALGRFGDPSPNNREAGRDALHAIGWWSVEPLLRTVERGSGQFRSNALLVLGRLADPRALPAARSVAAEDDTEWPPVFASLLLGRMRDADDRTLRAFRDSLASRGGDEKRKVAVVLALGKLHRRRAEEAGAMLAQVLAAPTPSPSVHNAALLSLGFFRSRVAEPSGDGSSWVPSATIREALASSRAGPRLSAVVALAVSRLDGLDGVFLDAFERDDDREVRRVALLALGKPRAEPDDRVTDLLTSVLGSVRATGEERRTAAYLLTLRKDARSVDALIRAASSPGSSEVAAAAVVALGGMDDRRVAGLLVGKLSHPVATVRAAAAVASVELRETADLLLLREALQRRLQQGETNTVAKFDMTCALDEIGLILRDRDDAKEGRPVRERPAPEWLEASSADLFFRLRRTHRQAILDEANLRVQQVLGVDSLFPYRPGADPFAGGGGEDGLGGATRFRREHSVYLEQYDLRTELDRRPFFTMEDFSDGAGEPPAVPREKR
ncbi:MAG: hypothetical protein HUU06_13345, partial [Planctomycetaceae bacterium]|nr:hypothetical protein [Planctomycetaceae bacterium]